MAGPEYTKEPTRVADWNNGTALVYGEGRVMTYNAGGERERRPVQVGNVRLFNGARNAVLELAEHLGCNAVELAERMEGGGLTEIAVALGTICAATEPGEDPDIGLLHRIASSAFSHLTTAPR